MTYIDNYKCYLNNGIMRINIMPASCLLPIFAWNGVSQVFLPCEPTCKLSSSSYRGFSNPYGDLYA